MFNKHLLPGALDKAVAKINQFPVLMVLTLVGQICAGKTVQEGGTACAKTLWWERYRVQVPHPLGSEHQSFQLPPNGCSKHTNPPSESPAQSLPWLPHVQWIKPKVLSPSLGSTWSEGSVLLSLGDSRSRTRPQALPPSRRRPLHLTIGQFGGCRALVGWSDRQLASRH